MEKINEKHENQVIEKVSDVNALTIHQSENASEKRGLVSVVYHASWSEIDRETFDKKGFEEDEHEWHESDSELPARIEYLKENADGCGYSLSDCRISLAEYKEPELTEQNISRIKTFFLFIRENENFYYSELEDSREAPQEHCRKNSIPTPNEIQYTPNGYYIKWNLAEGFSGSEIPLWRFIQKTLHNYFAKLGSNATVCSDATAMLYVSGFRNSSYVGFDLSEKVITIYRNEEEYSSPLDFVKRLPLTIGEIESYRSIKKFSSRVKINFDEKPQHGKEENFVNNCSTDAERERKKIWHDSLVRVLRDDKCKGEEYRLYQVKAIGNPKRRKNYK